MVENTFVPEHAENPFGYERSLIRAQSAVVPEIVTKHCVRGLFEFQNQAKDLDGRGEEFGMYRQMVSLR